MSKPILIIGALDTKGAEFAFLRDQIQASGAETLVVNIGVIGEPSFAPDIGAAEVARAAGSDLEQLRAEHDRGQAMATMARGAAEVARRLQAEGRMDGVIGMGGSGGASVITSAMRALPLYIPKLLVFTLAAGDMKPYVGSRNITVMPSIVDVAGLNRVNRQIFSHAATAIVGMARAAVPAADDRPLLAASMFGNTTPCVDRARAALEAAGYEVLVFHATGIGGQTMEALIQDGFVGGVLDVTTTEWADEIAGGILSAGPSRLDAAAQAGVPQVIAPGCLDMANFGPRASMPPQYQGRQLYEWNPTVTLMRTTAEENARMGHIIAEKLNSARGPVRVLIPLGGFSMLDSPGERFWDPEADGAFIGALRADLRLEIAIEELDANINDPRFADRAAALLLEMLRYER
ncbi:MAG TPA: Tm-1-like ATP-binding domain-containing protein [Roseiflexaceae bacterium]|nr:Tm-1-like ATP-binding domain-containing protein [Roseiflexaceae bacterium]